MSDRKTCLVLLVTPEADSAGAYRSALERAGFEVRHLRAWTGDPFDFDPEVIVLRLPKQAQAVDVATRLRAQARFAPLILIALTASADFVTERREGRLAGFDDVLPLPCEPKLLLKRVTSLLAARPPLAPCVVHPGGITKPAA